MVVLVIGVLTSSSISAAPLSSVVRSAVPSAVQQITSIDYRALRNLRSAHSLKALLLPGKLAEVEMTVAKAGINPETDIDQVTLVSYHGAGDLLHTIVIAQGTFNQKDVLERLKLKKIKPEKYLLSYLYPIGGGTRLLFLDPSTVLWGEASAVKGAINVRDNGAQSLEFNGKVNDLISDVSEAPAWSVLDRVATQSMIRTAIGRGRAAGDFGPVASRLLASDYKLTFGDGATLEVNLKTPDTITAALLASLIKADLLYTKLSSSRTTKTIADNLDVDSSEEMIRMQFRADEQTLQSMVDSSVIAPMTR